MGDDLEGFGATGFGCFQAISGVFGEIAKHGQGMVLGGCEEMGLFDGLLTSAQALEEPAMVGKSGIEMRSVFRNLPALGFKFYCADVSSAYFQANPMGRLLLTRQRRGGIPCDDVPPDAALIARLPIYGTIDAGRGFYSRMNGEIQMEV